MEELGSLVERSRSGDLKAFEELVRRFQGMACGCAYSVLGDFHLAEDVAQDAFVEVYRRLGGLRDPAAFPGWLRRIVLTQCNRMTRRKRVATHPVDGAKDVPSNRPDPAQIVEHTELRERVLQAVRALPAGQRMATTLYYIDGYSQAEVAEFLEVPLTTVKKRLHDARRKLRERMTDMVEDVLKESAPNDSFAERVRKAVEVYAQKGPEHDLMSSEWVRRRKAQTTELQRMGEEGFRVAVELSRAADANVRSEAAINLGLAGDERGAEHLVRLMGDESGKVRRAAVGWYAVLVHPDEAVGSPFEIWRRAATVPDGIEYVIGLLDDDVVKVRGAAVTALGAYAALGDERIEAALRKALDDPAHKVRHTAARMLGVPCSGCGTAPKPFGQATTARRA